MMVWVEVEVVWVIKSSSGNSVMCGKSGGVATKLDLAFIRRSMASLRDVMWLIL